MTHDSDHFLADGTIRFLPSRLNHQPVIVLGLTADEMWLTVVVAALTGTCLGSVAATLLQSIALVPSGIVLCIGLGLFVGGNLLRRHKRGKPQTWLYRHLQWQLATHCPPLAPWVGADALVTRGGLWSTRRSPRP
ncbi:TIGR03750 family conjugal transfer protein [Pseudomonas gingeri]|uniref:TIGR03750 family conjugal transfer protein n=1 Tax=Pseudomonas gingeri TaxID=117681 RepID=A0A7Y7YCV2_9PSED|nr:TIGR03750 family conjugal transfer protein [Pseudomonas gingeri]NWA02323.1 TIGR03750 family conjugal transfer protein [Pseudomonas gingeri]NWA12504.1 TIGR03750 family conjugal transfer protein [Pseudomonas gingeri]NWA57090.1 TIGR03750 family conjugal transfer protein [Pseudomonas gingeri]NWA93433.1 TIGR03750 family conjugal transfer protein [Pseudomonas gingeri]NWB02905.1 TIGR03750 family conjugal transfer protein [Pseudomonas gingeri]